MNKQTDYILKIADTPTDDDVPGAAAATPPVPAKPGRTSRTQRKRRGRRGSVQRLTPEAMAEEIDRVHHLDGGPTLARDTDPAD
jgi:hypothetical protein